jgi:hypothetical protein
MEMAQKIAWKKRNLKQKLFCTWQKGKIYQST